MSIYPNSGLGGGTYSANNPLGCQMPPRGIENGPIGSLLYSQGQNQVVWKEFDTAASYVASTEEVHVPGGTFNYTNLASFTITKSGWYKVEGTWTWRLNAANAGKALNSGPWGYNFTVGLSRTSTGAPNLLTGSTDLGSGQAARYAPLVYNNVASLGVDTEPGNSTDTIATVSFACIMNVTNGLCPLTVYTNASMNNSAGDDPGTWNQFSGTTFAVPLANVVVAS